MPNNLKQYDGFQVLKSVFDVDKNCLRVCVVDGTTGGGPGFEVIITHTEDSIRLGNGVNFFTSLTDGGRIGLDVAVMNSVLPNGAATEAKQDTQILELQDINTELDAIRARADQINADLNSQFDETQLKQDSMISELQDVNLELDGLRSDTNAQFDETQVKQDTQITELQAINVELDQIRDNQTNNTQITKVDGIYDAGNNVDPSNVGIITQQRNVTSDDIRQTERPTSVRGSTNTDVVSQDVSLHDHSGNEYTSTNPVPISIHGPGGQQIGNIGDSLKVASDSATPITIMSADTQTDAFGRLRVSNPKNIFEWQFRYDTAFNVYWDEQNLNGATQGLNGNEVGHFLNGDTQAGSQAIVQTRRYIEYIPGKSKQILFTGNFKGGTADWDKRIGSYDNNNGLFFQLLDGDMGVVLRSSTSGTPIDTRISQSAWNGDRLNGAGGVENPSGITLDFTKQQLFFIDLGYLGTGDVRFGFYIDGMPIIAHTFTHGNVLNTNYMQSATLPIRAELLAIGTPAVVSDMQFSCVSISTEGQESQLGRIRAGNVGTTAITYNATEDFIFGIRINPLYPYSSLAGAFFQILSTSGNNQAIWRVYQNPTLAGPAPTWVDVPNSIAQSVSNIPAVSGGTLLASGYISNQNNTSQDVARQLLSDIFIGRAIDGTPDTLVLTLQTISGNASALFAGQWRELQ